MRSATRYALLIAAASLLTSGCARESAPVGPHFNLTLSEGTEAEPNNTCSTAQDFGAVTFPFTLTGSLATDPQDTVPPFGDLDFIRITGNPNTVATLDLEGQDTGQGTLSDPVLGVFTSGCIQLAVDDDGGVGLNSRLVITIPADGILVVGVTRFPDFGFTEGGIGTYLLTIQGSNPALANDDFANATVIPALGFSDAVDITVASTEAGEPTPSCADSSPPTATVWYRFTPTETRSISASAFSGFPTVVAAYTGTSLPALAEVGCGGFGGTATFSAAAGQTYHVQVAGLSGQTGPLEFRLDVTPPPTASFTFFPAQPSVFDVVQFVDSSSDPGQVGIASHQWSFGDGATGTGCCPTHTYAVDGDYTAELTVTTLDGRTASTSQTVRVQTHDVAIIRFLTPRNATAGQTRRILVGVSSNRSAETVTVQLLKSVPGDFQLVASLTQLVPVGSVNRTTDFTFNYVFTGDDASIGKVTFKAVAVIVGAPDALPGDNEAIAAPTTVNR